MTKTKLDYIDEEIAKSKKEQDMIIFSINEEKKNLSKCKKETADFVKVKNKAELESKKAILEFEELENKNDKLKISNKELADNIKKQEKTLKDRKSDLGTFKEYKKKTLKEWDKDMQKAKVGLIGELKKEAETDVEAYFQEEKKKAIKKADEWSVEYKKERKESVDESIAKYKERENEKAKEESKTVYNSFLADEKKRAEKEIDKFDESLKLKIKETVLKIKALDDSLMEKENEVNEAKTKMEKNKSEYEKQTPVLIDLEKRKQETAQYAAEVRQAYRNINRESPI